MTIAPQAKPSDIIKFIILGFDKQKGVNRVLIMVDTKQPNGSWQSSEPIWLGEKTQLTVQGNIDNNAGDLL